MSAVRLHREWISLCSGRLIDRLKGVFTILLPFIGLSFPTIPLWLNIDRKENPFDQGR